MIKVTMKDSNATIELEYPIDFGLDNLRKMSLMVEGFINSVAAQHCLHTDPPTALVNGKPSYTLSASNSVDHANSAGG